MGKTRTAVPRILDLFAAKKVQATWATVGFLFCESKDELLDSAPEVRPTYANPELSNYTYFDEVGKDEGEDPYYFAPSLISKIRDTPGQEIATHTMSHTYCLEPGMTVAAFEADLGAAMQLAQARGIDMRSIVFPRNQYGPEHLKACMRQGITHFRGNPPGWAYRATGGSDQTPLRRALRLIDAYSGILGNDTVTRGAPEAGQPINRPATRFLRPCAGRLARLQPLHLNTIKLEMTVAAKAGRGYHLWWHPHNFGQGCDSNMAGLRQIIEHFHGLRDTYGMISATMDALS